MAEVLERERVGTLDCEVVGCAHPAPASMSIDRLPAGGPNVDHALSRRVFLCLDHFHELLGRSAMERQQRVG